jgi:UPF0176 protein
MSYVIASFYKFYDFGTKEAFTALRQPMLDAMHHIGIKGTIILALEGINGSFAGTREQMDAYYQFLRSDVGFEHLNFKETYDAYNPFSKAKVKLREEIVTMGLTDLNLAQGVGTHVTPEQWHELIQDPEVLVLDTRNDYEFELGTFKNAINPDIDNFRDFPEYVQNNLNDKKDKKIAMFCTGGIRCEKTAAYLVAQGFESVYQLHDGILNYIESTPVSQSLWEGSCFVFDDRVAVDNQLNRVLPQLPEDYKHLRPKKRS